MARLRQFGLFLPVVKHINEDEIMIPKNNLVIVSDSVCEAVIDSRSAFEAVESVFAAMARGDAYNFPVIREAIGYADALYGFKSGFDKAGLALGLKSGGYWPGNMAKGLTNHQSTIFLFDPDTGKLKALVGGNYLTAIRTAASSAVSISHLACKNAKILGIIGAGHQASFQLRAACEQRQFEKIVAWNKSPERLESLAKVAKDIGLPFESLNPEQVATQSDVIITITSAHESLLLNEWIQPGTHIACMGTDTKGKQEVDPELLACAMTFTDEIAQSISIGEAQHAITQGLMKQADIVPIGDVINGKHPGRKSAQAITLFDGTGVGLQDLAVASSAVELAIKQNKALFVEL